jgi:hypothetical protein
VDERTCAEAVAEWFRAETGIATVYDYPISNSNGPLPDAVVLVARKELAIDPPSALADLGLAQAWVRLFTVEVSVMVGLAEQSEQAASDADAELRGYGKVVEEAIWADASLGGRVEIVSPELSFDYSTPFVRREDGTTGRFGIFSLTVAEGISPPE